MEQNEQTYSSKKVIAYYEKYESLQKPEQTIFNFLEPDLGQMKMLDIGIGAGRTTLHFASYVKQYIGVDYSAGMVEACIKKFSSEFPSYKFQQADVRNMEQYSDHEFDFVLFSFNGIDYMAIEERLRVFRQIRRILKPGGYFCFSSHNIQSLERVSPFKLRLNLFAWIKQILVWKKVKKINKSEFEKIKTADSIYINDGAHDFGLQTHYFRPSAQKNILHEAGYNIIRLFSLESGAEIRIDLINFCTDRWVYFLCQ